MYQGIEAMQGLSRMQRSDCSFDISKAQRHHTARISAVVSLALDQAHAEPGREYTFAEEWFDCELQVCGTARETDRGLEVKLVVSHLRLDSR
jgi:hypothetical protein